MYTLSAYCLCYNIATCVSGNLVVRSGRRHPGYELAKLNCKHVDMKTEPSENRMGRSHSHVEAAGCVRPPLRLCTISYTSSGSRRCL